MSNVVQPPFPATSNEMAERLIALTELSAQASVALSLPPIIRAIALA